MIVSSWSSPVPPKTCMSICSSRHITKVLTWGSSPKRKMTGKHRARTVGKKEKKNRKCWVSTKSVRKQSKYSQTQFQHPYWLTHSSVMWPTALTDEHVSDAEQEVCREEGDSVEGERLQTSRATGEVEDPDHHTAQAEVDGSTVHDDPVMALWRGEDDE